MSLKVGFFPSRDPDGPVQFNRSKLELPTRIKIQFSWSYGGKSVAAKHPTPDKISLRFF